jgi:hypothetical protein
MKINDIYESTTAGSIATVAAPMSTQKRNGVGKGVYGNEKAGNLLTGKKTSKKYANSVNESFDTKQKVIDYFMKNGKTAGQGAAAWERGWRGKSAKKTNEPVANNPRVDYMAKYDLDEAFVDGFEKYKIVYFDPKKDRTITSSLMAKDEESVWNKCAERGVEVVSIEKVPYKPRKLGEATLEEDDIILVPGQGRSRKTGFIKHGESRLDHEVEMARSDLFSAAKNAKQVYELIADLSEEEGLEGWVQEKIIKANDYLNTIREYLEGKQVQGMTEAGFPGAPDVKMPPMKPSSDPHRDKLTQEYMDLHREIKSLVDIPYSSNASPEQKIKAKTRIKQLDDRIDQIKAILEPRKPPNEWQKKTYGYDDNWNIVGKGMAENEMTGGVIAGGGVG